MRIRLGIGAIFVKIFIENLQYNMYIEIYVYKLYDFNWKNSKTNKQLDNII